MLSPVSVYVDKFSRIGVKGNVMLETLHPSVKKYCLLTDDSPWPISPERGSLEIRVIPLFQSTCMAGGDSGCGRLRNRELLVLLNESVLSSLRSTMDVILQLCESLRCATVFVITDFLLGTDFIQQQRCRFLSCEGLCDCLISFRLCIFAVFSQGLLTLWRNSMNLHFGVINLSEKKQGKVLEL